jgi:hypothetical protein
MVVMECLFMELVSSVMQHILKALDPMVEDMFQFGPLTLVQRRLNAIKQIWWPSELLFCQCAFHVVENPQVRGCQVRTIRRMGTRRMSFSAKSSQKLSGGKRGSCQDAHLTDENALSLSLEVLCTAVVP